MTKLKVRDLMTTEVPTLRPNDTIKKAATRLALEGMSGAPIVDNKNHLLGFVSENDILTVIMKYQSRLDSDIVKIWSEERKTVVFVTHIIDEALRIATRIVLFSDSPGKIVKEWTLEAGSDRDLHSPRFVELKKEISETMAASAKSHDL